MGIYSNWIKGILVTEANDPAKIDYTWLKQQGVKFVVVRAGNEFAYTPGFDKHIEGAYQADLPRGLTWRDNPNWVAATLVMNLDSARALPYQTDLEKGEMYSVVRYTVTSPKSFNFGWGICDRKFIDEPQNTKPIDLGWARDMSKVFINHLNTAWGDRKLCIASTDAYVDWCKDKTGASMFDWINHDQRFVAALNVVDGWAPTSWAQIHDIPDTAKPNALNAAPGCLKFWRYSYVNLPVNAKGDRQPLHMVAFVGTSEETMHAWMGFTPGNVTPVPGPGPVTGSGDLTPLYSLLDHAAKLWLEGHK